MPSGGCYPYPSNYAKQRFCSKRCSGLHNRKRAAPIERFRTSYQVVVNGCWQWSAGLFQTGYGRLYDGERSIGAHCFSYRHFIGPIAKGLTVDHICRNRACVNPLHLRLLSSGSNVLAGLSPSALNKRKTRCLRGHQFSPANTHLAKDGHRTCRECSRLRARRWREIDPQRARQPGRNYRTRNPEKVRQQARDYRARNLEQVRQRGRDYWAKKRLSVVEHLKMNHLALSP